MGLIRRIGHKKLKAAVGVHAERGFLSLWVRNATLKRELQQAVLIVYNSLMEKG